jgi:hypothetical protein
VVKKCPECGRFMTLVPFEDVGKDPWDCYMWWYCADYENHYFEVVPVPAPEYQWLWNCLGIPAEALLDWEELLEEYTELWNALPRRYKTMYRQSSPAMITR